MPEDSMRLYTDLQELYSLPCPFASNDSAC